VQSRAGAEKFDLCKLILRRVFQPLREPGREREGTTVRQLDDDAIELAIIAGGGAARLAQMCDLAAFQGGAKRSPGKGPGLSSRRRELPALKRKRPAVVPAE